jgi:ketosteroid isomerase-like protein
MSVAPEPVRLVNARRFFMSCSVNDFDTAAELLSPQATYSVPGHGPISGAFHGRAEITRHLTRLLELTKGTLDVLKWDDWMMGESHLAVLRYAQAQSNGRIYKGHQLFLVAFDPGDLLADIQVFFEDQDAIDRFFS